MILHPYLNFDGNCREAFEFYRSAFRTEFDTVMTFGDMPPSPDMPPPTPEHADKIMHVSLPVGPTFLMGSDWPPSFGPMTTGNAYSVSVSVDSRAEAERLFHALSDGGRVTMPLDDTFWGAYFGMCADRFGVQWMVSFDQAPAA